MIKTIVLDFGGVLFYSPWPGCRPSPEEVDRLKNPATEVMEKHWPEIQDRTFQKADFRTALLKTGNYKSEEEIKAVLNSLFNINYDVLKLAKALWVRGLKLYSLNNERPFWTDFRRMQFSLDNFFAGYFVSCQTGFEKPDIESYASVLRNIKESSNECLFIDDKQKNIKAAKRLGFKACRFKNARRLENELKKINLIA